jgi:hypothetical protein
MISARKQLTDGNAKPKAGDDAEPKQGSEGMKKPSNYNFDEALAKVQEWNEALKCASFAHSFEPLSSRLIECLYPYLQLPRVLQSIPLVIPDLRHLCNVAPNSRFHRLYLVILLALLRGSLGLGPATDNQLRKAHWA